MEIKQYELNGKWNYELDENDCGISEKWFERQLKKNGFIIPGTTAENNIGEPVIIESELSKESVKRLREEKKYTGAVWYQTNIKIEEEIERQEIIELFLERVMWESKVFIDNFYIGKRDSLSTPHRYDLTDYLNDKMEHRLTICIDNRDIQKIGPYPSAYTDETQTIWNGIIGRVELQIYRVNPLEHVIIGIEKDKKRAVISFDYSENKLEHIRGLERNIKIPKMNKLEEDKKIHQINRLEKEAEIQQINELEEDIKAGQTIEIEILIYKKAQTIFSKEIIQSEKIIKEILQENIILENIVQKENIQKNNQNRIKVSFQLKETILMWDEWNPILYDVEIKVKNKKGKEIGFWKKEIGFCQRSIKDGMLYINEKKTFLRGNIDCCMYPLTGYPPMEEKEWTRILTIIKEYGLNHVRFHSWCPPEAAFEAADKLGIYVQIEGPMWMDYWTEYAVGTYKEHYTYLPLEAKRIIENYSYHPSFCIFSNGNELNGDFNLLEVIIKELKKINPYLFYTLSTNWDRTISKEDDIYIAQSVDGIGIRGQYFLDNLVETGQLQYEQGILKRNIPVISHEVGQYSVYPNVNEIKKYKGVLKPVNLKAIKQDLSKKNLLKYIEKYVKVSGKLAKDLYKAELEAAFRTKKLAGIQLLGLQDFQGQSTATVGLLDVFYEEKGIITSEEFRTFCNETVILLNIEKYKYKTKENLICEVEIVHYGETVLKNQVLKFLIIDRKKNKIYETSIEIEKIQIGHNLVLQINESIFQSLQGRTQLQVIATIPELKIKNSWNLWVYEEKRKEEIEEIEKQEIKRIGKSKIYYTNVWNEEIKARLKKGETILLIVGPKYIRQIGKSTYFPVFWSPVHFLNENPCGMYIDNKNPLFSAYFPCDEAASVEWKPILEHSVSINIDTLYNFEPITMLIPNFYHNHKYSNMMEMKVGNGKLFLCSCDLEKIKSYSLAASYLMEAIINYMDSAQFCPTQLVSFEQLDILLQSKVQNIKEREDIALNKAAYSNSEKSELFKAEKGNDGNRTTMWLAADNKNGYYWKVDLGDIYDISGTKVVFPEKANYKYSIAVSQDNKNWKLVVNKTDLVTQQSEQEDNFIATARYVKIVYSEIPTNLYAGHKQFSVYRKEKE